MSTKDKAPADTYTLRNGRQVKMTFGLLQRAVSVVGSAEHVPLMFLSIDIQSNMLQELLASYDKEGSTLRRPSPEDLECELDEIPQLLRWVSDHLCDFFVTALQQAKGLGEKLDQMTLAMTGAQEKSSPGGSPT